MLRPLATGSWWKVLSVAIAGLLLNIAPHARAGIVISVQDVSAPAGTSGNTLEVDPTNTGTSSVDIMGFSFELIVPTGSGITFTAADIHMTLDPYIFASNSFLGPDIRSSTSTPTKLDAGDLGIPATTMDAGSTLGLGRVSFDVDGSAPSGPVTVTLTTSPVTSLTDPDGNNITITTYNNGTITIPTTTVPEPSALISAALGLMGAAWMIRGRGASSR